MLIKNYLYLVGAEVFNKLIIFAAFVYLARLLGPASLGYVEWAAAVLMCAGLIVDQGLSAYGAREIAKSPPETARLVREIVTARFMLAAIGYLVILTFALGFVRDPVITRLLLVFGLSLWAIPLMLQWVFQGLDRMNLVALTQMIRSAVFAGSIFLFVRSTDDLLFVAWAEVAAVSCAAVFGVVIFRRKIVSEISLRPAFSAKLFREGLPIGISQMFWVVKMFGATLIVGLIATAEETGYFASALRILVGLHSFVWLYYLNLLPSLSRAWARDREQFSKLISNSMRIVCVLCLFGAGIWILLAPVVMTSIYGASFSPGVGALQWMAGACAAAAVSGHYRFGLIAAGFQNREMLTSAIGAATAAMLIPIGYYKWGTSGAAAALCAAEIVVLTFARLIARRTFSNSNLPSENSFRLSAEAAR